MTDDLVGRLRSYADTCTGLEPRRIITDAADHIAGTGKLVARIEALEAENRKLREGLTFIRDTPNVAYRLTAKEALGEPLSWEERNGWDERG